jgi:hypothetical protein
VIGRHLGVDVRPIAPADAPAYFGFLAPMVALDSPATSAGTRALLGWEPTQPGLLPDLEAGHSFTPAAA